MTKERITVTLNSGIKVSGLLIDKNSDFQTELESILLLVDKPKVVRQYVSNKNIPLSERGIQGFHKCQYYDNKFVNVEMRSKTYATIFVSTIKEINPI